MSEPIIIKTPQPDTEERLVLVPPHASGPLTSYRDATPADLERGGWVKRDRYDNAQERVDQFAAEIGQLQARADTAEGLLIQRETELRLAREDGDERERDLRQAYERVAATAEKAEGERDDAEAAHNSAQPRVYALEAEYKAMWRRNEGSVGLASQALHVGLRECERLRGALLPIATGRFASVREACDIAEAALGADAVAAWNAAENARAALGEP